MAGVWYLEKDNYFIEITNSGAINGAFRGSEYDFKGKIKSKEYNSNANSLKTLLSIAILDMGSEPEYIDTTYVLNKISQDKLKLTYTNGESYDFIYIAKNIPAAEEILDAKDNKKETIIKEPPIK